MKTVCWLFFLALLTGCATTGPNTGHLDLSVVDAHFRSDLQCAGQIGRVLAREGTQAALTSLGLPPGTTNAISAALAKLSGALDKPDVTLAGSLVGTKPPDVANVVSFVEVCGVVAANAQADLAAIKAKVAEIRSKKTAPAAGK